MLLSRKKKSYNLFKNLNFTKLKLTGLENVFVELTLRKRKKKKKLNISDIKNGGN